MNSIPEHMKIDLAVLLKITVHCRNDMHDSDEQCIDAYVEGDIFKNTDLDIGEMSLIIIDRSGNKDIEYRFNMCTLVALARRAILS